MTTFVLILFSAAYLYLQCMVGGTVPVYSYPAYIAIGVAALLAASGIRRPDSRPFTPVLWISLLFLGYILLRCWTSPYPYLARADLFLALACFATYLLSALYLTSTRLRLAFVWILAALALFEVAIGGAQFIREDGVMLFGFQRPYTDWRASGTLISGNHFAGFLETVAILFLSLAIWGRIRLPLRVLLGATAFLCYVGVVISGSRGGMASSVVSIFVFAILSLRTLAIARPENRLLAPAVAILGGLSLLFAAVAWGGSQSEFVRRRIEILATQQDVRVLNWEAALDHFNVSPVFGTGAGTHLIYGRLFRRPKIQADPIHAHNDYLELLAEYGIIGGILAFLFLIAHLSGGWMGGRKLAQRFSSIGSNTLALNLGAMGGIGALLAHSVVDFNTHIPGNAILYAFLFGMLANPGHQPIYGRLIGFDAAIPFRVMLPLMGLVTAAVVAPRYYGERLAELGRIALRDRQYSTAVQLLTEASIREPLNDLVWYRLGEAHRRIAMLMPNPSFRRRHFRMAVAAYQKGLRALPQDADLFLRLGQALDGLNRHEEAEQAYQKAIKNDPNRKILHTHLAAHYLLTGDTEKEKECHEEIRRRRFPYAPADDGYSTARKLKEWKEKNH